MIKKCDNCAHRPHTQNQLHGNGNRVFNEHSTKTTVVKRCTVCGREETTPRVLKANERV